MKIEESSKIIDVYQKIIDIIQVNTPIQCNQVVLSSCAHKEKNSTKASRALTELKQVYAIPNKPRHKTANNKGRIQRRSELRHYSPPSNRSKRTEKTPLPPIAITRLDSRNQSPISSQRHTDSARYRWMKSQEMVGFITKKFGAADANTISKKFEQLNMNNQKLTDLSEQINTVNQHLKQRIEEISDRIDQIEYDRYGCERLLNEGFSKLQYLNGRLAENKIAIKGIASQNRVIPKSVNRIASLLDIKTTETNDPKDLIEILHKTKEIFGDPGMMEIVRSSRKNQRNKVNFKIYNSTSSKTLMPTQETPSHASLVNFEPTPITGCISEDENGNTTSNLSLGIPLLTLSTLSGASDFFPKTRSTRRAFSSFTSLGAFESQKSTDIDQEVTMIGKTIGAVYVERFAAHLVKFNSPVELDDPCIHMPDTPTDFTGLSQTELFAQILSLYKTYKSSLYLAGFTKNEIFSLDSTMLKFVIAKEAMVEKYCKEFDQKVFIKEIQKLIPVDEEICCWIAHDFVQQENSPLLASSLFKIMHPYYERRMSDDIPQNDITYTTPYTAWFEVINMFLDVNDNPPFHETVIAKLTNLSSILPVYTNSLCSSYSRAGLMSLLRLGKHLANQLPQFLSLNNNMATSMFMQFIRSNKMFPSCMRAASDFFSVAHRFADKESVMWHTTLIYHQVIIQISRHTIQNEILNSFLSALTSIVANRQQYTIDQLGRLYFLQFLIKNFELEAFLAAKPNQQKPTANQTMSKVSYLDIPKLSFPSCIPSLNLENPKLQLHFQPRASGNMRASMSITDNEYTKSRQNYPIYLTIDIHSQFVQLMFATLIDHSLHRLDIFFCDPFPQVNRKPNVLFTLMQHLERKQNQEIIEVLEKAFQPPPEILGEVEADLPAIPIVPKISLALVDKPSVDLEPPLRTRNAEIPLKMQRSSSFDRNLNLQVFKSVPNFIAAIQKDDDIVTDNQEESSVPFDQIAQFIDYQRMLRLTVPGQFHPGEYQNGTHIASGAFGAVMAVTQNGQTLAVKILEKSRNEFDNPHLIEVYTEVSILEICKGDRRITQLHDYGCTTDSYYIVMEFYPMSLKSWRKSQANPPIKVMLRIFREFLKCATVLTEYKINHFDIKCDNVMLDVDGMPCIADFGESMSYTNEKNCYTLLNRGTEWIKSPEMLSIALNSAATNPDYDRRAKVGAGPASDVWSIGCMFFELIAGEYLFVDSDWSRFFLRITDSKEPLLTEESLKMLPDDERFPNFLRFILVRSRWRRPNLQQVIAKFDEMFPDSMKAPLPQIKKPILSDNNV